MASPDLVILTIFEEKKSFLNKNSIFPVNKELNEVHWVDI